MTDANRIGYAIWVAGVVVSMISYVYAWRKVRNTGSLDITIACISFGSWISVALLLLSRAYWAIKRRNK